MGNFPSFLPYSLTYLLTHLLTYSLTHLLTHLLTRSLTYLLTHSLTYSLTYLLWRPCRRMNRHESALCTCTEHTAR